MIEVPTILNEYHIPIEHYKIEDYCYTIKTVLNTIIHNTPLLIRKTQVRYNRYLRRRFRHLFGYILNNRTIFGN